VHTKYHHSTLVGLNHSFKWLLLVSLIPPLKYGKKTYYGPKSFKVITFFFNLHSFVSLSPFLYYRSLQLSNSLYYSLFLFIVIFLCCVTRFPLKIHILVASIQSKNRVFCWNYSPITLLLLIFHKIRKQSSLISLISWVVRNKYGLLILLNQQGFIKMSEC